MGKRKMENTALLAAFFLAFSGAGCSRAAGSFVTGNFPAGILCNLAGNAAKPEGAKENAAKTGESAQEDAGREEHEADTAAPDQDTATTPERDETKAEGLAAAVSCSYDGTVFEYDGTAYDMRERDSMVNAVMGCIPVGEYIVIENHTGPHNLLYTVFNTRTREFEKDIAGVFLTFYNDDIHTAVYAFWNEICAYDGTVLATLDIGQYDIIRDISFSEDHTQLKVSIYEEGTNEQQERVELLQLPDFPD